MCKIELDSAYLNLTRMSDLNSSVAVCKCGSKSLLKFLSLDEDTSEEWQNEDLAAMVRHQLSAPLVADLKAGNSGPSEPEGLHQRLAAAAAIGIMSFGDLLFHQKPPGELLKASKEFFKRRCARIRKGSPDWMIAFLFYNLSILAARQHNVSISRLTPADLLAFTKWAIKQEWVNATIKDFLLRSAESLKRDEAP